ncbi:hypothetical protein U0070_006784 [Myodes glareolus]|uniref:40S ribosomal protein S19 n=1 Tax=Myodes glareolus TaxID=447135 RepID=A0AAW0HZQ5_MYOGA
MRERAVPRVPRVGELSLTLICCSTEKATFASLLGSVPELILLSGMQRGGRTMPGVTVKDVHQQEFLRALAAFLRKSGKLKVPEWADTVKLAKHKELAPYDENWFYT